MAYQAWTTAPEINPFFAHYTTSPNEFDEMKLAPFEKFVVLLYVQICSEASVDPARKFLFAWRGRQIEAIPPTRAALFQHTKRAIHQAGFMWGQMHERSPDVPLPRLWGWKRNKALR